MRPKVKKYLASDGGGSSNSGVVPPKAFRLISFPREFERSFFDRLDKKFMTILFITFLFTHSILLYLSSLDYTLQAEDIQKIREAYIKKIYEAELVTDADIDVVDEGEGSSSLVTESDEPKAKTDAGSEVTEAIGTIRVESVDAKRKRLIDQAKKRRIRQDAKRGEVSGRGVLGILTAGGGGGIGDALVDVFAGGGAGSGTGDLDAVIQDVGGIATATSRSQKTRRVKGGGQGGVGAAAGETIDAFVEGTGVNGGISLTRKGNIQLSGRAAVSGRGKGSGQRNADVVTRVISAHSGAIEHCYNRALKLNPNLKGEIIVTFTITADGHVSKARVMSSTLRNTKVERCIINNIRRWRDFPKIDKKLGNVNIRQKFIFG